MGLQAGAERQENMVAQCHRSPPKSIERLQEQGKKHPRLPQAGLQILGRRERVKLGSGGRWKMGKSSLANRHVGLIVYLGDSRWARLISEGQRET